MNQWKAPFRANREMPHERRMTTSGSSSSQFWPFQHNQQGGGFGSDLAFFAGDICNTVATQKMLAQQRRKSLCHSPDYLAIAALVFFNNAD
jgi:hypothetical protein